MAKGNYSKSRISKLKLAVILFLVLFLPLAVYAVQRTSTTTESHASGDSGGPVNNPIVCNLSPVVKFNPVVKSANAGVKVTYVLTVHNPNNKSCYYAFGWKNPDAPLGTMWLSYNGLGTSITVPANTTAWSNFTLQSPKLTKPGFYVVTLWTQDRSGVRATSYAEYQVLQ